MTELYLVRLGEIKSSKKLELIRRAASRRANQNAGQTNIVLLAIKTFEAQLVRELLTRPQLTINFKLS